MGHMNKDLDPRAKAIAAQLFAEIGRSEFKSMAKFARHLDVDYTTLYARAKGNAAIPMQALFMYLDALGIQPEDFFEDAFRFYRRASA